MPVEEKEEDDHWTEAIWGELHNISECEATLVSALSPDVHRRKILNDMNVHENDDNRHMNVLHTCKRTSNNLIKSGNMNISSSKNRSGMLKSNKEVARTPPPKQRSKKNAHVRMRNRNSTGSMRIDEDKLDGDFSIASFRSDIVTKNKSKRSNIENADACTRTRDAINGNHALSELEGVTIITRKSDQDAHEAKSEFSDGLENACSAGYSAHTRKNLRMNRSNHKDVGGTIPLKGKRRMEKSLLGRNNLISSSSYIDNSARQIKKTPPKPERRKIMTSRQHENTAKQPSHSYLSRSGPIAEKSMQQEETCITHTPPYLAKRQSNHKSPEEAKDASTFPQYKVLTVSNPRPDSSVSSDALPRYHCLPERDLIQASASTSEQQKLLDTLIEGNTLGSNESAIVKPQDIGCTNNKSTFETNTVNDERSYTRDDLIQLPPNIVKSIDNFGCDSCCSSIACSHVEEMSSADLASISINDEKNDESYGSKSFFTSSNAISASIQSKNISRSRNGHNQNQVICKNINGVADPKPRTRDKIWHTNAMQVSSEKKRGYSRYLDKDVKSAISSLSTNNNREDNKRQSSPTVLTECQPGSNETTFASPTRRNSRTNSARQTMVGVSKGIERDQNRSRVASSSPSSLSRSFSSTYSSFIDDGKSKEEGQEFQHAASNEFVYSPNNNNNGSALHTRRNSFTSSRSASAEMITASRKHTRQNNRSIASSSLLSKSFSSIYSSFVDDKSHEQCIEEFRREVEETRTTLDQSDTLLPSCSPNRTSIVDTGAIVERKTNN